MDRYKYYVTPFSPIRELIPGKSIRAPFTADLDKDEVFLCMKHGPVFRLFPGKDPIKVTGSNFESLHKAKFEEDEIKELPPVKIEPVEIPEVKEEVVVAPPVEEDIEIFDKEEFREEVAIETPQEEEETVVEEQPVEEKVYYEEELPVEEEPEEEVVESSEEVQEEVVEETEVVEEVPVEAQAPQQHYTPQFKPNYNYSKKKGKNKNKHN